MKTIPLLSVFFIILALLPHCLFAQHPPVIDVHLHAYTEVPPGASASWAGEPEVRALKGGQ